MEAPEIIEFLLEDDECLFLEDAEIPNISWLSNGSECYTNAESFLHLNGRSKPALETWEELNKDLDELILRPKRNKTTRRDKKKNIKSAETSIDDVAGSEGIPCCHRRIRNDDESKAKCTFASRKSKRNETDLSRSEEFIKGKARDPMKKNRKAVAVTQPNHDQNVRHSNDEEETTISRKRRIRNSYGNGQLMEIENQKSKTDQILTKREQGAKGSREQTIKRKRKQDDHKQADKSKAKSKEKLTEKTKDKSTQKTKDKSTEKTKDKTKDKSKDKSIGKCVQKTTEKLDDDRSVKTFEKADKEGGKMKKKNSKKKLEQKATKANPLPKE